MPVWSHKKEDIRKHRFLIISSVFPPDVIGGAEISAKNLAQWLLKQGAEVGILTTAKSPDETCNGTLIDGLKIWRVWMPRPYPQFHFSKAKAWQKPLWHLQDHFDPRNRSIVARVLDEFKPTFINIHVMQGLGYNALSAIAESRIPTVYFLHDLSLACFRMGMFRNGSECQKQCATCKVSSTYKLNQVKKIPDLSFCSPSRANIETLTKYFPVKDWPHIVTMNANTYPPPTVERAKDEALRILYVGRLHASKGVDVLLNAAQNLAAKHKIKLTIVGSGPDESALRQQYGNLPWCKFTGQITQQDISNHMANSDVLCIPSIWAENSPGVIIHALGLGLPVIGSNKGGIPELVEHNRNGWLVPPNNVAALQGSFENILANPSVLNEWRYYALSSAHKFDQDYLGNKILDFIYENKGNNDHFVDFSNE